MRQFFKYLILFYQKYLSLFSYGSCRYYPTCSQYAIWQFENNGFFKAIYFTIARILKCNQFFKGGIDYPIVKLKKDYKVTFKKTKIKYWYIPFNKNRYLVVKNKEWNKNNDK